MMKTVNDILKSITSTSIGFENVIEITVNTRSYLGDTPLHATVVWSDLEAIKILVENGALINAPDSFGYTPLHTAAELGHQAAYDLLITLGANTNLKNIDNDTAYDILRVAPKAMMKPESPEKRAPQEN